MNNIKILGNSPKINLTPKLIINSLSSSMSVTFDLIFSVIKSQNLSIIFLPRSSLSVFYNFKTQK